MKKILFIGGESVHGAWRQDLAAAGYETAEASTGDEVLCLLGQENNGISLVIFDLLSPDIDGVSVLKKIKKDISPKLPVIIHTIHNLQNEFNPWLSEAYLLERECGPEKLVSNVRRICPTE